MFTTYIRGVIRIMIVFLFGSTGEIITEKSGHLNLGTPGIMCMGATGAVVGAGIYVRAIGSAYNANAFMAIFMPLLFCLLFSGLTGLLYCFLVNTLQCNQNVTGLTITTLGGGVFPFVSSIMKNEGFSILSAKYYVRIFSLEFCEKNWFTKIFLSHSFLVYLAIIIAVVAFFIMKKTRIGLSLRAVGESPSTADASGINVSKYKYIATIVGSALSGMGGLYYLMVMNNGALEFNIESYGWLAVALVIFSLWSPAIAIGGSLLFAIFYQLPRFISVTGAMGKIIELIPYLVTIIVLIIVSLFNKRETQPPAGLGVNYFREDR